MSLAGRRILILGCGLLNSQVFVDALQKAGAHTTVVQSDNSEKIKGKSFDTMIVEELAVSPDDLLIKRMPKFVDGPLKLASYEKRSKGDKARARRERRMRGW